MSILYVLFVLLLFIVYELCKVITRVVLIVM